MGATIYKSVLLLCDCAREKERRVEEARALREKQVRVSRISKRLRFGGVFAFILIGKWTDRKGGETWGETCGKGRPVL